MQAGKLLQSAKIIFAHQKCKIIFIQYCASNAGLLSQYSYRHSNFAIAKVVAINLFILCNDPHIVIVLSTSAIAIIVALSRS